MVLPLSVTFENLCTGKRDYDIVSGIARLLEGERTVLDIGCGDGRLTKKAMEKLVLEMHGLEVSIPRNAKVPVRLFDGQNLPYPDSSFDSVFLIDVLHHTEHSETLIGEALRVTKKSVIIKDHYYTNQFDLAALKIADFAGNFLTDAKTPFYFKSKWEWAELLRQYRHEKIEWTSEILPKITFQQIMMKLHK